MEKETVVEQILKERLTEQITHVAIKAEEITFFSIVTPRTNKTIITYTPTFFIFLLHQPFSILYFVHYFN